MVQFTKSKMSALRSSILLYLPLIATALCPTYTDVKEQLGRSLSPGSSISNSSTNAPRWSTYAAPSPVFVIAVALESDVATTVGSTICAFHMPKTATDNTESGRVL